MSSTALVQFVGVPDRLQIVALAWLDNKARRSESAGTVDKYRRLFASFTATLARAGLALDSDPADVANVTQAWAGKATRQPEIARTTFNHRLAVISSFYTFAVKRGHLSVNPIASIERGKVQEYAGARALDFADLQYRLSVIDRSTLLGARDYALLMLALFTGRRAAELAALEWRDLEWSDGGQTLTVNWRRMKGGKTARNVLDAGTAKAIVGWLHLLSADTSVLVSPEAPLWRALSPRHTLTSRRLAARSISLLCERRLGVSKVHALRHTFAHAMEESGAKVSEIQAALGHSSLATTGRYLAALRSDSNPYAPKLAALYGTEQ